MPQIRLTLTCHLQQAPRCPMCRQPLQNNAWRPVLRIAYCAICAHDVNTGLHIETERMWPTLTTHGHTSTAAGLDFYTPHFTRDVKCAAHLVGKWLQERGALPPRAYEPQRTEPTTLTRDPAKHVPFNAKDWDGADIGEQRDQT